MSKEELEAGDIVRNLNENLGLVMRNDEDSGLLVAYPEHDELTIEHKEYVTYVTNIEEATK